MKRLSKWYFVAAIATPLILNACSSQPNGTAGMSAENAPLQSFSSAGLNFRLSLTDAPSEEFTSVFVNIRSIELWTTKGGHDRRYVVANPHGPLDLLTLRNGVLLPIKDFDLPQDETIKQIRMLIEPDGNYGIRGDGSRCDLQTPSGHTSGLKLMLAKPVTIAVGYSYSLVIDFDAAKSVVQMGNDECLLKPVLRVGGFSRAESGEVREGGLPDSPTEDLGTDVVTPSPTPGEGGTDEEEIPPSEVLDR